MPPDSARSWPSDIEIARKATLKPIQEIGAKLGVGEDDLVPYGRHMAKVSRNFVDLVRDRPPGRLVLVTAVNPTRAGEGKTTTTVGLGDALNRLGRQATICLREPSLGPCFGMKGGAAGGGYAQVVPMEAINLHFTGDLHAIGVAHNLLAAAIDNHVHQGNKLGIDPRRIAWKRAIDLNDRALRDIVVGLGGVGNSMPRETGFEITAASEVMAIFCLAESLGDLRERLGRILVGRTFDRRRVHADELNVQGSMTALLRDAFQPNIVQTLEGNPAVVHGGPFANIAHGCNSVVATRFALGVSEIVVTEAGFGADLGAQKFFDIKCRSANLEPHAVVIVATVRALKLQGGASQKELSEPDVKALRKGLDHLAHHVQTVRQYGVPVCVAVNRFPTDHDEELQVLVEAAGELDVAVVVANHWAEGGAGAEDLAHEVLRMLEQEESDFKLLYPDDIPLLDKVRTIAQKVYGAEDVVADSRLRKRFRRMDEEGFGHLPVCVAKTQYSLSTDPDLKGRPALHHVPIRDLQLRAGAGFVLVLTGSIVTMPGLPRVPAAESIDVDENGAIEGLF